MTGLLALTFNGCGGGLSEGGNSNTVTPNTRVANTVTSASSKENPVEPAAMQPPNAGTTGGKAGEAPSLANDRGTDAVHRSAGDPVAVQAYTEELLRKSTRRAPENSEFAVALTDVVVERRTFLRHPVIARVEKVTKGSNSTISLVTTDGKMTSLPGSAIPNLSIAPAASILKAAGITPAPAQPSDRKSGASGNRN